MTPADLKSTREALGLSQAEFARLIGMRAANSDDTVRRWEAGRVAVPGTVEALLFLIETVPAARWALERRALERRR
jgi:DNA-binding transcriptional regulator YiaG